MIDPRDAIPSLDTIAGQLSSHAAAVRALKNELSAALCREAMLKAGASKASEDTGAAFFRYRPMFDPLTPREGNAIIMRPKGAPTTAYFAEYDPRLSCWVTSPLGVMVFAEHEHAWEWCPIPGLAYPSLMVSMDEAVAGTEPPSRMTAAAAFRDEVNDFPPRVVAEIDLEGMADRLVADLVDSSRRVWTDVIKKALVTATLAERKRCETSARFHAHHAFWGAAMQYRWSAEAERAIHTVCGQIATSIRERPEPR